MEAILIYAFGGSCTEQNLKMRCNLYRKLRRHGAGEAVPKWLPESCSPSLYIYCKLE